MEKKIQAKSTKAEILEAYQELETAFKQLQAKPVTTLAAPPVVAATAKVVEESKPPSAAVTPPPPKDQKMTTITAETFSKLEDGTVQAHMDAVIKGLNQLGEQFNTALSQLSTNLLVEATHLKDICTNVGDENARLATLYALTIEEDTLSVLLKQYTDTAQQYEETLKQKREEVDKAWLEKTQAWQKEKEESSQRLQEQENTDKKTQKRDETEYRYDLTLKRNLTDEEYAQQQKQQQQALEMLKEQRYKEWEEREKALAEREKQFEESKAKVEKFPKDLEAAIKKAKDEGTGIARHQAKNKADLLAKELAGEEEVYRLRIKALEEEVAKQSTQLDRLNQQLEAALKQVQELAVKAIEGSSSHSSLQALKEVAIEQAKNLPKAK
jgi:hypothetical protein